MITVAKRINLLFAATLISSLLLPIFTSVQVNAVSPSDWQAGRIVDDEVFFNPNSMSTQDIQNFLNSKVPTCNAQPGNPACLKNYSQDIPTVPGDAYCGTINGGAGASAATIIKLITQACSMNPAAMLVLIQKEQGLITSSAPTNYQYQFATGYCVYDTPPPPSWCADTDGFFRQIYYAAKQFQRYKKDPQEYNFAAGRTSNIQYSPNASCGRSPVTIQTAATAGLYNYTPYQPNQAALNAGWGEAHCGAYGNRNFWLYYWSWFGSPLANKPVSNVNWKFENLEGGTTGLKPSTNTVGITPKTISYEGDLYVFYYDSTSGDLKMALADSTGWHYQTIDGNSTTGGRINANVGQSVVAQIYDESLHIFYYDATNSALRHAWFLAANGWQFETLDGTVSSIAGKVANVGMSNAAAEYANNLHTFYYDATNGNLRHGWFTPGGTGWKFENLEGDFGSISHLNSDIGQNPDALIYGGSLQLVYYDVTNGNLRHSWYTTANGWKFENLDGDPGSISRFNSNVGQDPTLTTHNGTLQIFHYDAANGNLRHGWASPTQAWKFENLDGDPGSISRFNSNVGSMSKALSFDNVLYIFFRENSGGTARYAWADTSGWHFAPLEGDFYSVSGLKSNTGFWPTVTAFGDSLQLYYFDNDQRSIRHAFGAPYW